MKPAIAKKAKNRVSALEGTSLRDYLSEPERAVRRGELATVVDRLIEYKRLERRSRWLHWRIFYWLRGRWLILHRWLDRPMPRRGKS